MQPSADGTIYAVSRRRRLRWSYDTGTPIRSSPAVDGEALYVGGGAAIRTRACASRETLIDESVRPNDLNASPALGKDAVYIGGESGEMFSVPYDWCLRADNAGDARCTTTPPARPDGATLAWVNTFGDVQAAAPASIPGNAPVTLLLAVRAQGAEQLAVLDSTDLQVTLDPPSTVSVDASGDGKFVTSRPPWPSRPGR